MAASAQDHVAQTVAQRVLLGHWREAEKESADVVVVASRAAAYLTRTSVVVDGGASIT